MYHPLLSIIILFHKCIGLMCTKLHHVNPPNYMVDLSQYPMHFLPVLRLLPTYFVYIPSSSTDAYLQIYLTKTNFARKLCPPLSIIAPGITF